MKYDATIIGLGYHLFLLMKHNYNIPMEKVPNHKGLNENITSTVVYVSSM